MLWVFTWERGSGSRVVVVDSISSHERQLHVCVSVDTAWKDELTACIMDLSASWRLKLDRQRRTD